MELIGGTDIFIVPQSGAGRSASVARGSIDGDTLHVLGYVDIVRGDWITWQNTSETYVATKN